MTRSHVPAFRSWFAAWMIVLCFGHTSASARHFSPPDQPGPFHVGVTTIPAVLSGGRATQIQVFYPTLERRDEESTYTVVTAVGAYQLRSPLGAVHNAQAAPGLFPLVVHDHGGGGVGADHQRVIQLPLHETMASHGLVIAVALHSANPIVRVRDLSLVIDVLLDHSADSDSLLSDSVDPALVGISGVSVGGAAAIGAAAGWADHDISPDPRIKAMVLYEPGPQQFFSLDDASTISIPYLVMGGAQSNIALAIPVLFVATIDAKRYFVLTPNATHFNFLTGMGAEIDQTREAALLANPEIPEPLTTRTASNAAAARAYELWNFGEIVFPVLGYGAGSGRNICSRVGIDSIRSLDADHDGYTDSPPFMASDDFTLQPAVPEEVMVPLIQLYTIAFWKSHLDHDHRYRRYLTPGYAKRNELEAVVWIE